MHRLHLRLHAVQLFGSKRAMSPLTVDKRQDFVEQIRAVNRRVASNLRDKKKLTKKDLDSIKNLFLDYYEIYMHVKRSVTRPEILDESGIIVSTFEEYERHFRSYLQSNNDKVVEWSLNWIDLLQEFRWLILINDGLADKPNADDKVSTDVDEFMASLDKE